MRGRRYDEDDQLPPRGEDLEESIPGGMNESQPEEQQILRGGDDEYSEEEEGDANGSDLKYLQQVDDEGEQSPLAEND